MCVYILGVIESRLQVNLVIAFSSVLVLRTLTTPSAHMHHIFNLQGHYSFVGPDRESLKRVPGNLHSYLVHVITGCVARRSCHYSSGHGDCRPEIEEEEATRPARHA